MAKRRNISLLAPAYRTEALKQFFNVTVDQVFQPGEAEVVSGFIGRKPPYFDAVKDFYKEEPTAERTLRQLEAAMVSTDENGAAQRVLFYEDFVNILRSAGAPVEKMERMIASPVYGWAPPIDLDKLLNFQHYYWADDSQPALTLRAPVKVYTADGSNMVFALPPAIVEYADCSDLTAVWIDDARTSSFTVVAGSIILPQPPVKGAKVKVMRYADLCATLSGLVQAHDPSGTKALSSGQVAYVIDAVRNPEDRVSIEGVGQGIEFVGDLEDYKGDRPYTVIDRRSRDRNLWSRRNRWVHRDVLPASAVTPEAQAARPIIEFQNNIALYDYGTYRLPDVTCVMSTPAIRSATVDTPARQISVAEINGMPVGSVTVDGGHVIAAGDRLLARQVVREWSPKTHYAKDELVLFEEVSYRAQVTHISGTTFTSSKWRNDPLSFVNNQIFTIEQVLDGTTSVYGLLLESGLEDGAVVRLSGEDREFWYDGEVWRAAQGYSAEPKFALYDGDGVNLNDPNRYPASTFAGSRIFGYAEGAGKVDPIIGQPLRHNEYGQIVFENDLGTRTYGYASGNITSSRFFAIAGPDGLTLDNAWHRNAATISQVVEDGVLVPFNLQANPDNEEPGFISRNQWFDHFSTILKGQEGFKGAPYAVNNWRDTARDLGLGTGIVQHDASLLRPMLLASDTDFSVLDAIRFVEHEYETFKRKYLQRFADLVTSGAIQPQSDAARWPEVVLTSLASTKTYDFAFALSRLGGGQFFVPATPAAMGMASPVRPEIITLDEGSFIVGHDGSMTPTFGDARDAMLLRLEMLIHTSIAASFKDREPAFLLSDHVNGFFTNGDETRFSDDDLQRILAPIFERWCQFGAHDYRTNDTYESGDPFTWNYSSIIDPNGRAFAGHWRGIYRYYFDTDRPHLTPWEMLGFANQPGWWVQRYGPAPYTSGNLQMWQEIEQGFIAQGDRAGVDPRYARSGLLTSTVNGVVRRGLLPIDDTGSLLDPVAAGIVTIEPSYHDAKADWKFGDGAQVEQVWRQQSSFGFAVAMAGYLLKPALFVDRFWDTQDTKTGPNGQPLSISANRRPRIGESVVHGERIDGVQITRHGIQQWVSDYMVSRGQAVSTLGDALRRTGVRLAHKVAGFTTSDNMRVSAENFGLVPQEDVKIILHQSSSTREEFYSGVLIEWTGSGYRLVGYDPASPEFTVLLPDVGGHKVKLETNANERVINPWRSNTHYGVGVHTQYDGVVYLCQKTHLSGVGFEPTFWSVDRSIKIADANGLYRPSRFTSYTETIAYGTVLDSKQDVINFLLGHGAYLKSRGWSFSDDADWVASVDRFIGWAAIAWEEGNFVTLSPAARGITFTTEFGMVLNVEQSSHGSYGLLDRSGYPIPRRDSMAERTDGMISITAENADIYGARVGVAEIEHVLVFSNKTIFDNIIYEPLYNLRQHRLLLSAQRAAEWAGRYEAPGFVLVEGEIRPSFDKAADDLRYMFDIEKASNPALRDHARHLIGFQKRDYLTALNMSDDQQFEFYQGLIQNKGTIGSFDKLLRSDVIGRNRDLRFLEEWAIRVGHFGAHEPRERWEFELRRSEIHNQPQFIDIRPGSGPSRADWVQFAHDDERWVEYPVSKTPAALSFEMTAQASKDALPTAGYVRRNEAQMSAFNWNALVSATNTVDPFNDTLPASSMVWIYDTGAGDWDIFKAVELSTDGLANRVTLVEMPSENPDAYAARFYMERAPGLTAGDVGAYVYIAAQTATSPVYSGFYQIAAIGDGWFEIDQTGFAGIDYVELDEAGPVVRIMRSARFATAIERADETPRMRWADGDFSYIDNDGQGKWAVYRYAAGAWSGPVRQQGMRVASDRIASALLYDLKTKIDGVTSSPQPLVLDHINIIDPATGLICGAADRELDYKLEYDPAVYSAASANSRQCWGAHEVGRLWWDLSTVRFMEAYTDDLGADPSSARATAEIEYRIANWNRIAPGSSVDVYEWVRSTVDPQAWSDLAATDTSGVYSGEVLGGEEAQSIAVEEFNAALNKAQTVYYFWVKGRTLTPMVDFRTLSARAVADLITSTASLDLAWLAPISATGMLVGGLHGYLRDEGTIVQVELKSSDYEGPVHSEWVLVRPDDETSLPPRAIWNKMRDSLVGFDSALQALPDPALHPSTSTGALTSPRQNIFDRRDGSVRKGIMEARRSFVEMTNYILARKNLSFDRLVAMNALMRETPLSSKFCWVQPDNQFGVEPIPPASEYDAIVYNSDDRDAFLTRRVYGQFIQPAPWDGQPWSTTPWDADFTVGPRVLLNNLSESRPQWSVWRVDLTAMPDNVSYDELSRNIDQYLVMADRYDHWVDSIAARDALPNVESGDRVLVYDQSSSDFWSVWSYQEAATPGHDAGYTLVNAQTYRTSDFIERADWYADGFSELRPPVIHYATIAERNAVEGDEPTTTFVRIDNDGSGGWLWTSFERNDDNDPAAGGIWRTVAQGNGTLQLSEAFFDIDRPVYGWSDGAYHFNLADVARRDGSFELRVLFDLLWDYGLLTDLEVNELFFSMLHFIHSQQDQVDWASKTTFLSVIGYNEPLRASPLALADTTETMLSYLDEVKPYRTKVREFTRGLTSDIDPVSIHAADFDKPRYFDPTTGQYRVLDINDAADMAIMGQQPWSLWYENRETDLVRSIEAEVTFDRIWPSADAGAGADAGAAKYINDSYQPTGAMKQKSLNGLMKLDFQGTIIDGRRVVDGIERARDVRIVGTSRDKADVAIKAVGEHKIGYDAQGSRLETGRPEELAAIRSRDDLVIQIIDGWTPGAPNQSVVTQDVSALTGSTVTLSFASLPESREAVAVFRDGKRARLTSDYTIDQTARTATVNLLFADASRASKIALRVLGHGSTQAIAEQRATISTGSTATFALPGAGRSTVLAEVAGVVADGSVAYKDADSVTLGSIPPIGTSVILTAIGNGGERVRTRFTEVPYSAGKSWSIGGTGLTPIVSTIVEKNGLRLNPPRIYYGRLTATLRSIVCDDMPSNPSSIEVWINGVLTAGAFTFTNGVATAVSTSLVSNDIMIIVRGDHECDVVGTTLSVVNLAPTDVVTYTRWDHPEMLKAKTEVVNGNADGIYFVNMPIDQNYVWATVNGRKVTQGNDYTVEYAVDRYDFYGYDTISFDAPEPRLMVRFKTGHADADRIVFTGFHGVRATPPKLTQLVTRAPNSERIVDGRMNPAAWEISVLDRERRGGDLKMRLVPDATEIVVIVNPDGLPAVMVDPSPFTIPDPQTNRPGIIWINAERIEYYGYKRSGNEITFSSLRRGTKRTEIAPYHSAASAVYNAVLEQHNFDRKL